jgi:endonuclease YncB( thermonuclease family)
MLIALAAILTCTPIAIDGDTIRCGREHIRLLGIDAPEMPGHCRHRRVCVQGDPYASQASLKQLLTGKPLTINRVGRDKYGRTLASLTASGRNISCDQIAAGRAVYVRKWDTHGLIRQACSGQTR